MKISKCENLGHKKNFFWSTILYVTPRLTLIFGTFYIYFFGYDLFPKDSELLIYTFIFCIIISGLYIFSLIWGIKGFLFAAFTQHMHDSQNRTQSDFWYDKIDPNRKFILLLRSFKDYEFVYGNKIEEPVFKYTNPVSWFDLAPELYQEHIFFYLTRSLFSFGTPILLGKRSENWGVGNYAIYIPTIENNWREVFEAALETSWLIVAFPGKTPGFLDEFQKIVDHDKLNKLVFIMPPTAHERGYNAIKRKWDRNASILWIRKNIHLPKYNSNGQLFMLNKELKISKYSSLKGCLDEPNIKESLYRLGIPSNFNGNLKNFISKLKSIPDWSTPKFELEKVNYSKLLYEFLVVYSISRSLSLKAIYKYIRSRENRSNLLCKMQQFANASIIMFFFLTLILVLITQWGQSWIILKVIFFPLLASFFWSAISWVLERLKGLNEKRRKN
ncbi:hypothetical protein [Aquimarina litoralis]|uniref:hypothetical protein n=1 Tax=Aquimarina litoralis TaxID=584605 RepID=UPI001C563703|nr:hypothetical protein [Aquimarina litoralis]MBW1298117.1 hypothetical protein [Aquimarina litoralis]